MRRLIFNVQLTPLSLPVGQVHLAGIFLFTITETSPYFFGNFRKNMLYNCFKKLFLSVEKISIKFLKINVN